MALLPRSKPIFAALLIANAAAWIIPSDVVELVARDHQTLLGRYSFPHFLWMLALLVGTVIAFHIARAPDQRARRLRSFRIIALFLSIALGLVIVDIPLRLRFPPTFRLDRMAYRRPPNVSWRFTTNDLPEARRSYSIVQPGYPPFDGVWSTDANGYRNGSVPTRCDVITLGDSFTEGSRVSNDQCWPFIFAGLARAAVYNLGMSGYSPQHYVESLKVEGLKLSPKLVICTLYEGNDFRSTEVITASHLRIKQIFRSSPIVQGLDRLLVSTCGPIGATWNVGGLEILSWLPLAAPTTHNSQLTTRYYAFAPKDVIDLCSDPDQFRQGRKWKIVADSLLELQSVCRGASAQLILVYVPAKPHVVLPLAADSIPPEKLRAFVAINTSMPLPDAKAFRSELLSRLDGRESVIAKWCNEHAIRFLSLTSIMREAAGAGRQVYYTYDQHWTPEGHEIAARAIATFSQ